MVRYISARTLVLLALCAALLVPSFASAAPRTASTSWTSPEAENFTGWLWEALTSIWRTKAGCEVDPFGRCITSPTTKAGCRIDPFGQCLPETLKSGCGLDPFGQCR
jgi:hypothetical protein